MKRILSIIMAIALLLACLCSCGGKEEKTDYYMIGYEAVEAGNYEKALSNFEIAAKEGDDQAAKAAKIVSSYLDAKEAYEVGDIDSAVNFINSMPSDYKYYAIADDVDTLIRKVYGYVPKEPEDSQEAEETEETEETEASADVLEDGENFTAQKAMEYVSAKYGVEGDLGMGLDPGHTDDGRVYYEIIADVGKDGESDIKTLRIFNDGTILEKE
ncbi:MAG: hypothetical protein IKV89_05940 [Clostridia bacterium]|nr:hypothetical protein [Clostridia bacterium]